MEFKTDGYGDVVEFEDFEDAPDKRRGFEMAPAILSLARLDGDIVVGITLVYLWIRGQDWSLLNVVVLWPFQADINSELFWRLLWLARGVASPEEE